MVYSQRKRGRYVRFISPDSPHVKPGQLIEKTLKELKVTQRNKIEEIKKKTNYYSTKSLLDRYDDGVRNDL